MARTKIVYTQPSRDTSAAPPTLSSELYAEILNPLCFVYPITNTEAGDNTLIVVPGGRYPYDGDISGDADWAQEREAEHVWRNVLAYEKMSGPDEEVRYKRIVKYKGKDAATAFPLLEKPTNGPLNKFWHARHDRMYTSNSMLDTQYLPIVYRWALQALSALITIHNHGIVHMDITTLDSFWLRNDLSLALVGFQSAEFINVQGQRVQGDAHAGEGFRLPLENLQIPTAKYDLFDWASLVFKLMTGTRSIDSDLTDVAEITRTGAFPDLDEDRLGEQVKKCWRGEYESAKDVMRDVVECLSRHGVRVVGDDIEGFDYHQFL